MPKPPSPGVGRRSAFGRLLDHFHTHPQGRIHEFAFWFSIGAALLLGTWSGYRSDLIGEPIALILVVVALAFMAWSLLPQRKKGAPPKLPPGKRGEIAQKVRDSKDERKRKKGGVPPGPPIRRG